MIEKWNQLIIKREMLDQALFFGSKIPCDSAQQLTEKQQSTSSTSTFRNSVTWGVQREPKSWSDWLILMSMVRFWKMTTSTSADWGQAQGGTKDGTKKDWIHGRRCTIGSVLASSETWEKWDGFGNFYPSICPNVDPGGNIRWIFTLSNKEKEGIGQRDPWSLSELRGKKETFKHKLQLQKVKAQAIWTNILTTSGLNLSIPRNRQKPLPTSY